MLLAWKGEGTSTHVRHVRLSSAQLGSAWLGSGAEAGVSGWSLIMPLALDGSSQGI